MRTYFSIGEVSKMTGFTINALRHYDKIGLCRPRVVNEDTKYRYYDQSQLFIFDIISFAKKINLSLEELSEIINSHKMSTFKDFLEVLSTRMTSQIDDLKLNLVDIENIQEKIATGEYLTKTKSLYQREIADRDIMNSPLLPTSVNNRYVKQREKLELAIRENNLKTTFESGAIYKIINNQVQQVSLYKAIILDYQTPNKGITHIPGGNYLCITYNEASKTACWEKLLYGIKDLQLKDPLIIESQLLNNIYDKATQAYELQVYLGPSSEE